MYAFSFDLYLDGEFITNVCIHAADRVTAWAALNGHTCAARIDYDAVQLVASVVVA